MLKRMKRLLRLRNKSGFTMVEVIIACALLGILIVGIMGFITPVLTSVRTKEANARAFMLSEAIDKYIANSIQYAVYVQPITGAIASDTTAEGEDTPFVLGLKYPTTEYDNSALNGAVYSDKGLEDLLTCFNTDLAGEVFEIKCIGVRWLDVPGENIKKLMLTNEKVDQKTCALDPSAAKVVFDAAFYDGLYPIIKFENYSNQYQLKNDDGDLVNQIPDNKVDIAPALDIHTEVYLTPDCYSAVKNTRENTWINVTGSTNVKFYNIGSNLRNTGVYKNRPAICAHTTTVDGEIVPSYDAALYADADNAYLDDNGKRYYYTNSFIYYIARKTKTASDPDTPAPTPEESEPAPEA